MKICIFLIIGFTHFVFYCDGNVTDDSYLECPVNFFRRKRAHAEYTRWHADLEPTQEFIVKVLDEDMPAPKQKKIVAVNIQPVTKGVEKIIIGGAMVTIPITKPSSTVETMDAVKDYTRFVPPTTVATRVKGDFYLAPAHPEQPHIRTDNFIPIVPKVRNPQRDESPPASPQFLPRSDMGTMRQYAPIAPVAFTQRFQLPPRTPPSNTPSDSNVRTNMIRKAIAEMIGSTQFDNIVAPTRTKSDMEEFGHLLSFEEDSVHSDVTRTTYMVETEPEKTTSEFDHDTSHISTTTDSDFPPTTEKFDDYAEKTNEDKDDAEDGIFYSYDYDSKEKNVTKGKSGNGPVRKFDDKSKNQQTTETDVQDDDTRINDVPRAQDPINQEYPEIPNMATKVDFTSSINHSTSPKIYGVQKTLKDILRDKRHQVCSMVKLGNLNFDTPKTLPEIEAKLKEWAEKSPVAKWVDITDGNLTAMERPIYMMIVDDPSSGQIISAKQTVVLVAGIQGRDQHAVTAAMYVLFQLIEKTDLHTDLLTKFRFWVIPVLNPDGYDYAMTFPHRREWTKNLRQNWDACKGREACHSCEIFGLRCTVQPCYGVNLDRNFEYQWIPAEELRMEHPCGALYAGKRQLSEVETNAFVTYLHSQHKPIFLFIAFKEGDVLGVMYPYSHTRKKRALDHVFKQRASRAAAAAFSISGRPYLAGQTSQFLPLYAGGIEDWVDGHLGVDNTFTIMMYRPADTFNSKLITERVVHEAYAAMDTLVLQSIEEPDSKKPPVTLVRARQFADSTHFSTKLLVLAIVLLISFT